MSEKIVTLPLFPLFAVLFPKATLPLHIFEDRYKRMINSCIENQTNLGVVLIKSGVEFLPENRNDKSLKPLMQEVNELLDQYLNLVSFISKQILPKLNYHNN